ncbi:Cytochrome c oxidase, subunit VIb [Niveomyces insectorum RCEF 264]|uniref:Cytochrome c oxidase, subunit VIb n=1 Tax=Niveomyces insectorum RCEF 264 TaxID=1081102 RepID=A0A162MQG4_9HYPO|nr:Cytochrome c oxidase, subunit VIb [Niveomyces insectorum RCEF 264]
MGVLSFLWPFSSSSDAAGADDPTNRAAAIRSGAAVPSRAERQRCWDSRDAYFACLDRHHIVDAVQPAGAAAAAKACGGESAQLERDCAAQWVAHFKKYRVANHQKVERLKALRAQGANEMQIEGGPGGPVPAKR